MLMYKGKIYELHCLGSNKYRLQTPYTLALKNAAELERMLAEEQAMAQRGVLELALALRTLRAATGNTPPPAKVVSPAKPLVDAVTEAEAQEPPSASAIRRTLVPPVEPALDLVEPPAPPPVRTAAPAPKRRLVEKARETSREHPVMLVAAEKRAAAPRQPRAHKQPAPPPPQPFTAAADGKKPRRLSGKALLEWIRAQRSIADLPEAVNG